MGFLNNFIKNAISEGIGKGISSAVGKATESIVTPKAENLANKTAEQLDTVADAIEKNQADLEAAVEQTEEDHSVEGFNDDFDLFPKWDYTVIEDLYKNSEDEYDSIILTASLSDDLIEKYQSKLKANGFSGDWQLMSKEMGGKKYTVDFTFVSDSQIQYIITK
ncbi:MAG: hypothetical protein MJ132_04795 [Clostridia bacterium]|nr:hypothetical protein [Clostridia bacterium]